MALFGKPKAGGFMDEIRCDETSYLIWKWHPVRSQLGINNRENAIRWNSSLRVKDGEVAVFVYKQKNGILQDYIVGPFDQILKTANLPVLSNIIGLAYEGGTPFQAEIFFINLSEIIQVKFGVPFFDVYDPRFLDFGIPVAVRGTISFKISDYQRFIKLHRLISFDLQEFQKQIRDAVIRYVKDIVANIPAAHNIPLIQIETKISQINDEIELYISERLQENFGVDVSGVDINSVEIDKGSEGYAQLMAVTKNITIAKTQAETQDYIERLRIQREEGQYSIHKQTQTANIGAFQVEKQAEIGIAGADALGKMGENGAGDINLNGGGEGMNMAAMMAGMAVGGAVGQNIAGTMNTVMSGINQPNQSIQIPPISLTAYYVAVDGKACGPLDINSLRAMFVNGQLNDSSLVWKQGMSKWEKVSDLQELNEQIYNMPPVPTKE